MSITVIVVFLLVMDTHFSDGAYSGPPEQIHLALGRNRYEMSVSWVTQGQSSTRCTVELQQVGIQVSREFAGNGYCFNAGYYTTRYINVHHAIMNNLLPNTHYIYRIKCSNGLNRDASKWIEFRTLNIPYSMPKIAFFADMGLEAATSFPLLKQLVNQREVEVILHAGDFAYDMKSEEGKRADNFMNMIQEVASKVPYQVIPGNHESENGKYTQYKNRFNMIDSSSGHVNNFFYSCNIGLIHFVAYNTQFYVENDAAMIRKQYEFLQNDLTKANSNRHNRPWIVAMGHHPFYCNCPDRKCTHGRQRSLFSHGFQLEELFYKHGVDINIAGHEHFYERMYPVFRGQVCSGHQSTYVNPRATVHFTSGSPGNKWKLSSFTRPRPHFTAFGLRRHGINVISDVNTHSIKVDFVLANGQYADSVKIVNGNRWGRRFSCPEAEKYPIISY